MNNFCTTREQSEKLLKLGLDPGSADLFYFLDPTPLGNIYHLTPVQVDYGVKFLPKYNEGDIPAWSLTALLDYLAKEALKFDDDGSISLSSWMETWSANLFDCPIRCREDRESQIEVCIEMIEKLKEYYKNDNR